MGALLISAPVNAESKFNFSKANEYSLQHKGRALLVLKDGKLKYEAYGLAYSADTATDIHSATKSFWCSAVAAMIDDGLVKSFDENLADTIDEWQGEGAKSRMTLRQILDLSSGLKPTNPKTDLLRQASQPGKYKIATQREVVFEPGSRFYYGPNHYYVLGEFIKRKLREKNESPLDYLKRRVLNPIGVSIASWDKDGSGDPNMPNGAHIKPNDWLKYGQFVLQRGWWQGHQIVSAEQMDQCLQPSRANAGYGLTFWLNKVAGVGALLDGFPEAPRGSKGGHIYPDDLPGLAMAAGAGKSRMYLIPSLNMVIVRQAEGEAIAGYQDSHFLGLLFRGTPGTMPLRKSMKWSVMQGNPTAFITQPDKALPEGSIDKGLGRLSALDRNGDGRLSRDEVPERTKRLMQNFDRIDANKDGFLSAEELAALAARIPDSEKKEFEQSTSNNGLGRLASLDRNNDGRVSRNEVPERAKRIVKNFDRIDSNSDGFLSSEEVLRIPLLKGGQVTGTAAAQTTRITADQYIKSTDNIVKTDSLADIDTVMQQMISQFGLNGAGLIVGHQDKLLYEKSFGNFSQDTAVPIASATKWLTVAVVMAAIDKAALKLDDPVSRYLPGFTGEKSAITIRQCLATTAGFSDRIPDIWNSRINLQAAVNSIATSNLKKPPGEAFLYGGAGFHVAGYAAMAAVGIDDWHSLFEQTIAGPLALSDTIYGSIQGRSKAGSLNLEPVKASNPWLGGGAISTLSDYRKFLGMLANDGVFEGRRILSASAIDEMFSIQTQGLEIIKTLHPVKDTAYGLGGWIESADSTGRGIKVRDMGVWGWNPWIDFERGYFAILGVHDDMNRLWNTQKSIESIIEKVLDQSAGSVNKSSAVELRTLFWQDQKRSYLIHLPDTEAGKPVPLVIMLHAGKSDAKEWLERTRWLSKADEEGFIVAAPNASFIKAGNGALISNWNDGSGRNSISDDIGFIKAMIEDIATQHAADKARIYITGVGNGASMAYRAGVELSDLIAAIAPVSGHLWEEKSELKSPVSLISFIGTEDPINPVKKGFKREMTGQAGRFKPPVRDSVTKWASSLGFTGRAQALNPSNSVTGERFGPAADGSEVVFYVIDGMGHGWPGDSESLTFSGITRHTKPPLDATNVIWRFFQMHSKYK